MAVGAPRSTYCYSYGCAKILTGSVVIYKSLGGGAWDAGTTVYPPLEDMVYTMNFGWTLALSANGKQLVVGAPYATVGGKTNAGAAYVRWMQTKYPNAKEGAGL